MRYLTFPVTAFPDGRRCAMTALSMKSPLSVFLNSRTVSEKREKLRIVSLLTVPLQKTNMRSVCGMSGKAVRYPEMIAGIMCFSEEIPEKTGSTTVIRTDGGFPVPPDAPDLSEPDISRGFPEFPEFPEAAVFPGFPDIPGSADDPGSGEFPE